MTEKSFNCRIGVMGGTFDPIHYGHLVLAETIRDTYNLDEIVFVPTGKPPHKKEREITDAKERVDMVALAIDTNPYFTLSTIEVKRQGYSYTADTLEQLKLQYPGSCELYFITGADAIMELHTWRDVERLTDLCRFIAAMRPGTRKERFDRFLRTLPPHLKGRIQVTQVPALEISSTDIRARVQQGKTIRYLLPETVEQYIRDKGLYIDRDVSNEYL